MKNRNIQYALLFIVSIIVIILPLIFGTKQIGTSSRNFSNQWVYKFHYLDGNVQGFFKAETDETQLIYSSNLENGTIDFQLYNSKGNLLLTFSADNATDTIKDIFVKGERYNVVATAKEAKGRFGFKME